MNLAIHGIEGKIIESNSFYSDPHDLVGKCDFVMANPPFNVNKVDKKSDFVKTDQRLFEDIGLPKADNGNYLWIQYFYHYLNDQGRAGFVMASSATDAGNTEKAIRKKLIETGAVDCIVAVGNNFFYTRSLPCHLWFLDKGKRAENTNKILMIDARHTFRKVNTTLNDFSEGQLRNFSAIMQAYRGDQHAIKTAKEANKKSSLQQAKEILAGIKELKKQLQYALKKDENSNLDFSTSKVVLKQTFKLEKLADYVTCEALTETFERPFSVLSGLIESYQTTLVADKKALIVADKKSNTKNTALRKQLDANNKTLRALDALFKNYHQQFTASQVGEPLYDYKQILNEYFPEDVYQDIEGLCKIVDLAEVEENDHSLTPRFSHKNFTCRRNFSMLSGKSVNFSKAT
jgi:type I restriction enzyme M protein